MKIGVELDYEVDVTDLESAYLTCYLEPNITLFMESPRAWKLRRDTGCVSYEFSTAVNKEPSA